MPKRALIINGANRGLNKDADLADIRTGIPDRSDVTKIHTEVSEATNIFTDYRGKFVTEYPTAQSSDGLASYTQAAPPSAWTGSTTVNSPSSVTIDNYLAGTASTNTGANVTCVYTTNESGVPTFTFVNTGEGLAVGNTFRVNEAGSTGKYVVVTVTAINSSYTGITEAATDSSVCKYDSAAEEIVIYNDVLYRAEGVYKWGDNVISSRDTNYMSFIPTEGEIGSDAVDANIKHGVDFWIRSDRRPINDTQFNWDGSSAETWEGGGKNINIFLGHKASGWNPQGLGDISNFASGILFDRQNVEKIGSWVAWIFGDNNTTSPSVDNNTGGGDHREDLYNFTGTLMDLKKGLYGSYAVVPNLSPSTSSASVQVVARKADTDGGILFDPNDCGTTTDDARLLAWDGQYAFSGGSSRDDWTDVKLLKEFYFCSVNSEEQWGNDSGGNGRDSNNKNLVANARPIGLVFFTGNWQNKNTSGHEIPGPYGSYCPSIEGKTIRLQFKLDDDADPTDGSSNPTPYIVNNAMDKIKIVALTKMNLMYWSNINAEANWDSAKFWDISRSSMLSAMDEKGWVTIERDVALYDYQHADYKGDDKILAFVIMLIKNADHDKASGHGELHAGLGDGGGTNEAGSIMCKFKEFTFFESSVIGWKQYRYVRFYQTNIKNGIESMLQPYQCGSTIDNKAADPWIKTVTQGMEAFIRKPNASAGITQGKIYYSACDEKGVAFGEHYLICEWDLDKGVKWSGSEDEAFDAWTNTGTIPLGVGADSQSFVFDTNPIASTYAIETGYPVNTTSVNALWKTATTIGKQVYIGNVAQEKPYNAGNFDPADLDTSQTFILPAASGNTGNGLNANPFITGTTSGDDRFVFDNSSSYIRWGTSSGDAEWANRGFSVGDSFVITEGLSNTANENVVFEITAISNYQATVSPAPTTATDDNSKTIFAFGPFDKSRILKTTPGMPAGFSDALYMDLEFGGDEIKVLESVGDRLLVFSKYKLSIVNVASDIDFIEGTFDHMGVEKSRQVCKFGEGVAFVNASGVYIFNGEEIFSISSDNMKSIEWSSTTSAIAYDAMRDLLWVWISNENIYYYCLGMKSWVGYSSLSDADFYNLPDTNATAGQSGYTHYAKGTTELKRHMFIGASTNLDAALDRDILLQTGKIDCGNIGNKKTFYDLYVSCLNAGESIKVQWTVDDITWYDAKVNDYKGQSTNASHGLYDDTTTRCGLLDTNNEKAKGKWIMFRILDLTNNAKSSLEIGDISLIYRDKLIK